MRLEKGFFAHSNAFDLPLSQADFDLRVELSCRKLDVVIEMLPVGFDGYGRFAVDENEQYDDYYDEND